MKKFRVGIIGTGDISHRHMKVYDHIPGMEVVAAADFNKERLEAFGRQYNMKDIYTDFRELLQRDDIDSVDVCVHNNLHAPVSIAVMKAGKACYCEKPMSASYADSKMMYDCAQKTGVKFAVQISSIFTYQAMLGRRMIEEGVLGEIYHAKVATACYRRRPSVDITFGTADFMSRQIAGHGQMVDLGIYDLGRTLFMLGNPELKTVYGKIYQKIGNPKKNSVIEVEDMGVGMAEYAGDLTMEILEAGATNMENVGPSYITGSRGALELTNIDMAGGEWSMGEGWLGLMPEDMRPQLRFTGEYKGVHVNCDLKAYDNQVLQRTYDPEMMMWFDNQMHWHKYLAGELTDETRYNTPLIGLNVSLLTDGVFISSDLGRSVTAEEIKEKSKSLSIWKQETPWGIFDYESTF
jgi:predicted dehydrogenase